MEAGSSVRICAQKGMVFVDGSRGILISSRGGFGEKEEARQFSLTSLQDQDAGLTNVNPVKGGISVVVECL
jgi:hypothetical protein